MNTRAAKIAQELVAVDGVEPNAGNPLVKHVRMAANPFRFFRGAAQLFYADLKDGVIDLPAAFVQQVPTTAIVGDCHVSNFGLFTEEGSYGEEVVFAPNDFDDACIGPAVWDLLRLAVSLWLTADYCRGIVAGTYQSEEVENPDDRTAATDEETEEAVSGLFQHYRQSLALLAEQPIRRADALTDFGKGHSLAKAYKKARKRSAGGSDFTAKSSLAKAIITAGKQPAFATRPERFARLEPKVEKEAIKVLRPYVDDSILDIVQRLGAGTGSVNVDRYYLLVGPRDYQGEQDLPLCHIVEVKQQRQAAALFHFPDISPVNQLNPAHLTVNCQRWMQRRPDLVLDDLYWQSHHWLIRSRHHARVGIDPEEIGLAKAGKDVGKRLEQYAVSCGQALALAHSRGDRRSTRFEEAMAKTVGEYGQILISQSRRYAQQTIDDHRWLSDQLQRG